MRKAEELQADVVEELGWDPEVDSSKVGVTVSKEGTVTLTGNVGSYTEKRAAERIARDVAGVHAVVNDLDVLIAPAATRDDSSIADAAVRALGWNTIVPDKVEWDYQRRAAYNAVVIRPKASPHEIKQKITAAFHRTAQLDADHVEVVTEGGKVTLRGTVRSLAEKDAATRTAWSAQGVTSVDNRLTVNAFVYS